ncbi:MAG: hypothetical protein DMF53_05705 [Acidobacteria bacterium]|nr:MAG: hypothetical protein DMF53_05705 [Acidobacteriota bacterium]
MAKTRAGLVTYETVREIALALPGVEEGPCYGTPGLRVRGRLFARLWEDGETLVLKVGFDAREMLMAANPETFYITDQDRAPDRRGLAAQRAQAAGGGA